MKKIWISLLFGVLIFGFIPRIEAETGVRYPTFTTSDGRLVRTQTAYVPTVSLTSIHGIEIGEPSDIHITRHNVMYITARLNNVSRIIIYDLNEGTARTVGEELLVNASGIFATEEGIIYVADRGGNIAYKLSPNGDILERYIRPNSPLFGAEEFQPRKIIADARGNVYILNLGIRGLAQFSNSGEFLGYFGANTITPTLRTILQFTFFTEEQRARLFNLQPPEISNMAIDQRGLIHTVSLGVDNFGVKRLNISGGNLLPEMFNAPDLVDVFVGPIGNIYVLTRSGRIYEYDREGNLLFLFGNQDISNQIAGLFNAPVGIAVDQGFNLYVVDRASNELTVFNPTEFASNVHNALTLYQEGNYIDSLGPWQDVLRMNDFFDLAHRGFGNAYFSLSNYEGALEEFRIANDRHGYSEAFWEVRNAWLLNNGAIFIGLLFALLFILVINMKLRFMHFVLDPIKKGIQTVRSKVKVIDDIFYLFRYLKNPADASYEIKRKDRISIYSATLLLVIFFGLYVYHIYQTGFLFNLRRLEDINILEELARVILPILLWVIANFLIGSIREGEGRLKDVYITTIFSLSPYFLSLPVLTILSQGLTLNELFIYQFIQFIAILVTVVYFFFMVKETFQSISISGFTMVMMLLGVFIVFILFNEIFTLGKDVSLEVYYRVFNR